MLEEQFLEVEAFDGHLVDHGRGSGGGETDSLGGRLECHHHVGSDQLGRDALGRECGT